MVLKKMELKKKETGMVLKEEYTLSLPWQQGSQQTPYYLNILIHSTESCVNSLHGCAHQNFIMENMAKHGKRQWWSPHPWKGSKTRVDVAPWFSGEHGGGRVVGFNDLKSPF